MADHVVIHERKEVWFKGDYPTCMVYSQIVDKKYPGYKTCICSWDDFIPTITQVGNQLQSSVPNNIQWYLDGTFLPGKTNEFIDVYYGNEPWIKFTKIRDKDNDGILEMFNNVNPYNDLDNYLEWKIISGKLLKQ